MQDATCRCGFGGVRRPCLACLLNERRRVRATAAVHDHGCGQCHNKLRRSVGEKFFL